MPHVRYQIIHETEYRYSAPVVSSQQLLHLTPRINTRQLVVSHQIEVEPAPVFGVDDEDYFGNPIRRFELLVPHTTLLVRADSQITVLDRPASWESAQGPGWEKVAQLLTGTPPATPLDASQYLFASPQVSLSAALAEFARASFPAGQPVLVGARHLMERIYREFTFDPTATTVATPLAEVLRLRRGVCQDFAHLMIGALRAMGLSARYVSGYLLTQPPPGQPRLIGADASHAWVAVFCPGVGWVEFDPTNNCIPGNQHILLAWGRDFSDVTPMRGVILGGGQQQLDVRVTVIPLDEVEVKEEAKP